MIDSRHNTNSNRDQRDDQWRLEELKSISVGKEKFLYEFVGRVEGDIITSVAEVDVCHNETVLVPFFCSGRAERICRNLVQVVALNHFMRKQIGGYSGARTVEGKGYEVQIKGLLFRCRSLSCFSSEP